MLICSARFARLKLLACFLALLVGIPSPPSASAQVGRTSSAAKKKPVRNWDKHPAIVEFKTSEDVYALGDIHGDYDRCVSILVACNILDKAPKDPDDPAQVQWKAKKAVLVCTGDMIDKWHHSVKVLILMRSLQIAAEREGGKVFITYGNHEAEFLGDPKNHKAEEFIADLAKHNIKPEDVAAGTDKKNLGKLLHSLAFAVVVNDWFFAHAGDTRQRTIPQLRKEIQEGVDAHGYNPVLTDALNGLLEARLHPPIWWEKNLIPNQTSKDGLLRYTSKLGVKHLVIGHQPEKVMFADGSERKKGKLMQNFDGLIFLIDVGMSRGIGKTQMGDSQGFLLRIRNTPKQQAFLLDHNGKVDPKHNPLWTAP